MTRRTRMLAAASLTALLAGCAGLHPGVAAEVGDSTITTRAVDDFAKGFCAYVAAQQPGDKPSKDIRDQALSAMIVARLAHDYGSDHDVAVDHARVSQTVDQVATSVRTLPDDERQGFLDEVRYAVEGDQYLNEAITAKLADSGVSQPDQSAYDNAFHAVLQDWTDAYGVDVDPRFGEWKDGRLDGTSGSLSVPQESDDAAPGSVAGLPAAMTCH